MNKFLIAALLVLSACTTPGPSSDPELANVTWSCPGGKFFNARIGATWAIILADGHTYHMTAARSADGSRYRGDGAEYWEHAGEAMLHGASGGPYESCHH